MEQGVKVKKALADLTDREDNISRKRVRKTSTRIKKERENSNVERLRRCNKERRGCLRDANENRG